jgi:ketosteroid isomerase-like protein
MPEFPRAELDEMLKRWLEANTSAKETGDWSGLTDFYTEDAVYYWNMGPRREFKATGRHEIRDVALGFFMKGFEKWQYPYHDIIIDDKRGTVIGFWKQVAPGKRPDGSSYEVDGLGGSWFEYAGDYKWKWQKDFFDMGNVTSLIFELAGANLLDKEVKLKMKDQAHGNPMPLVYNLRPEPSLFAKVWNFIAMIRIVIFGS